MGRINVLLTGATGNMGIEGLKLLYADRERFQITVFALPARRERKVLARYKNDDRITIVWGDLKNFAEVKKAVDGVDIVLHVGALVSPMADTQPDLAWEINFGGTKNIVDAILARPDRDRVKMVYIGTVAQTGNRPAPYHWGRVGDPLIPSVYDYYALSKIAAERYVIESGLKQWVSLRQTGILHDKLLKMNNGIAYHQPLNNHLEWVTARDSGRILLNVCAPDIPEKFWNRVYNIGGGDPCRLTAYQFTDKVYRMLGVDFRKLEEPNWYALRNFHGQWYYDSDILDDILHFRSESIDDALGRLKRKMPSYMRILQYLPKKWVRENIMRKRAMRGNTPLFWIRHRDMNRIKAFLGSNEKWKGIPDWDDFIIQVDPPSRKMDHGYDEHKSEEELGIDDMKQAAAYRGGECLSTHMEKGNLRRKLQWQCSMGHAFAASPYLILKTGHWCGECLKTPWNFDEIAKSNPFIGQVWYSDHEKCEDHRYA